MAVAGILVGMYALVFYLFILLVPVALLIALQVWLCRKSVKLGIILPGLSLALSLFLTISLVAFSALNMSTVGGYNVRNENGEIISEGTFDLEPEQKVELHGRVLIVAGVVFLVTNIPTVVFGGIWLHYKGRRDTYEDLKKMRIEDLE